MLAFDVTYKENIHKEWLFKPGWFSVSDFDLFFLRWLLRAEFLNMSGQTTRVVNAARASLPRFRLSRFRSHVVTAFRPIRRDPRHRNSPWCHMMSMMSLAFRLFRQFCFFRLDKGESLPGRHPIFQPINKGGPDAMLWFFWQHWELVDEGLVSAQRIHWRCIFWLEVVAVAGKGGFVSYKSFKTAEFHSRHRRTVHGVGHSVILFELRSMEVNVPAKSSPWGSEEVPCDAEMKVWKFALHELEKLCSDLVIYQRKFSQHPIYGVSKSQQKTNSKRREHKSKGQKRNKKGREKEKASKDQKE